MAKKYLIIGALLATVFIGNTQSVKHNFSYNLSRDSVITPASMRYTHASFLRKLLTGKNYRKEWSTPVKMPVFNLQETGLTIVKMGGGMQTKSLRLEDKQGRQWALRTVDKYAEGAVPTVLKNTIAQKLVQEMISAAYPYAAITVGELAFAVNVTAPRPVLYFVPDADFLGPYRAELANTVCFLERREPVPDAKDTEDLVEEKMEDQDILFLQKEILKARLLDMLVADWDRHEGQWLWVSKDSAGSEYYTPVPLDRDQAFFLSDGLLSRIAKLVAMPHINSFKNESRNLKRLSYKSWEFDRFFLNALNYEDWKKIIEQFQNQLPDHVIEDAVKKLPPEIYAISGPEIAGKLKSRRAGLLKNALDYYEFLSKVVTIAGTSEDEIFSVSGDEKGMKITGYKSKDGNKGAKIYERHFLPSETKQVSIYGLEGNDHFIVDESTAGDIRIRIYGDKGRDVYNIRGKARSRLYDAKSDNNQMVHVGTAKVLFDD